VRRLELNLRDRLVGVFEQYASARRDVEIYTETILPNATTSLDMIRKGYEQGEFGYLTLLTAQRTFFNVSLSYLSSLGQLCASSVELEGMLLRGGLEPVE
jgi:cobalt-zinc-cadmium efflux system outer membrane protein